MHVPQSARPLPPAGELAGQGWSDKQEETGKAYVLQSSTQQLGVYSQQYSMLGKIDPGALLKVSFLGRLLKKISKKVIKNK